MAGLIISCIALRMAAPAQRLLPEPLTFATTLLFSALPASIPVPPNHRCDQQWLLPERGWSAMATGSPSLSFTDTLQRANASAQEQAAWQSDAARAGLLLAALGAVDRASTVFAKLISFPELFAPAVEALTKFSQASGMPQVSYAVRVLASLAPDYASGSVWYAGLAWARVRCMHSSMLGVIKQEEGAQIWLSAWPVPNYMTPNVVQCSLCCPNIAQPQALNGCSTAGSQSCR